MLLTGNNDARARDLSAENAALRATVTDLRLRLAALETLADTDPLVPLPNRRAFERELERVIAGVDRYTHSAAVVFIDLNGLKAINDSYGHATGDAVLLHVARTLKSSLRASDIVARIGGDEFAVILVHLEEDAARAKACALVSSVASQPLDIGRTTVEVRVTAGLAMISSNDTIDAVLARADDAMYAQRSDR